MHKIELKDAIKALFGGFTESEYINYFTSKFPKLLVHCYNAVENEAKDLLAEYFYQDVSAQAPTAVIDIRCLRLEGSKLAINCHDVITFPETKIEFCSLKVEVISHLFIEENKSFTNFLQRNASNVTHLEFLLGSLKFDSVDKILQKLPKLKEIQFSHLEYEASKTNQTIQTNTCQNLVELKIWGSASSKLLQAFQECQTIKNLTVKDSKVTLEEILHKYASLEELFILVNNNYPVSHQNEANSTIHQLKVLKISLLTKDEKILEKVMTCILKQNNLQQFSFGSNNCNPSQSLCKQLAAHICQLKHLRNLVIYEKLFEEVEAFVANCRITNTRLEELACQLNYFKLLPSSLLGHFTNLRKLDINCYNAEEIKVKDLFNFLNRTQMTSIRLEWLSPTYFQLLKKLQVQSLQVLEIQIRNEPQDKVPAFDILQEFLPRHPNITEFEIKFYNDYDELKSLELIPMIVGTLTKLERLGIGRYSKITPAAIEQIVALKTLKSWKINRYESQIFYKT